MEKLNTFYFVFGEYLLRFFFLVLLPKINKNRSKEAYVY